MEPLRLGWEAVTVMGEDGPLECGVVRRLGQAEVPVGALGVPGQEGR